MKRQTIYFAHSTHFDYQSLYKVFLDSNLSVDYDLILPHLDEPVNSLDIIRKSSLFIAEVSVASLGLGIELGEANVFKLPILCVYQRDAKLSSSLKFISADFIEYDDLNDLICQLANLIPLKLKKKDGK